MVKSTKNWISLRDYVSEIQPHLIVRLEIFVSLCQEIRRFHAGRMVHNDINFDTCRIDPATLSIEILESNLSLRLSGNRAPDALKTEGVIGGRLEYLSPERTGKTAHPADFRSDLYSLGVVLYQMITDTLPFDFEQPLEIIHAHIALPPVPAVQINPKIPRMVSRIVSKLLAKSPIDRYQSAAGLIFDLKNALAQLRARGSIEHFSLGQRDLSPFFEIPNKLYGRYREVQLICDTYKPISEGRTGTVFISGPPGIGKSFLVNNIQPFLLEDGGVFTSGKFDQYEKTIPYSAIAQVFSRLMQHVLTFSDAELKKVCDTILEAVGKNGQLIVDVIPELELVIGNQPQPEKLSSLETRNRFNYLFQNFVRAVTTEIKPVIIFLDDLQWADRASIELMEAIMLDSALRNVLFICTYRTIEAKANPFLSQFLETVVQYDSTPHQFISLGPVDSEYIETLIKDMLSIDLVQSGELVQLIAQKTNRNPLFIKEFLMHLHKEGLIRFRPAKSDAQEDRWEIDEDGIFRAKLPDTIVDLLTKRIRNLSEETQEILKTAACIGIEFSFDLLKAVYRRSVEVIHTDLKEALGQGIITRTENGFQFIHDRVREAVYLLNSVEKRNQTHYAVGKALMAEAPEKRSGSIFLLASQMNSARQQLSAEEGKELIRLNLAAGKKAKEMTAFAIAYDYFSAGLALLDDLAWYKHYDLALDLHTEAADAAYMCADFDEMERHVSIVVENARSDFDRMEAHGIRLSCLLSQNRFPEILDEGIQILRRLGHRLPKNPGRLRLLWEFLALNRSLRKKKLQQLKELNHTKDSGVSAQNRLVISISSTAYRTRTNLFMFIVLNSLRSSLTRGSLSDTAVYLAHYGILLGILGRMERGYKYGQLALSLSRRSSISQNSKARILFALNGSMLIWKHHIKESLNPLLETYQFCMESGNLSTASMILPTYFNNLIECGAPLKEVLAKLDHYYEIMRQYRQKTAMEYLSGLYRHLTSYYTKPLESTPQHQYSDHDEKAHLEYYKASNDKLPMGYIYCGKLVGNYFRRNYWEAIKNSDIASRYLRGSPPSVINIRLMFFDALARLAFIRANTIADRNEKKGFRHAIKFFYFKKYHLKKVAADQKKMKNWGRSAPMNLLNKWNLVEAERANLLGHKHKAETHYHRAIELSEKYGFLHEEALCQELAARFYLQYTQKEAAKRHFSVAIDLNEKRDAEIKHRQLLEEVQGLFAAKNENRLNETVAPPPETFQKGLPPAEMDLQFFSAVIDTISNEMSVKKRLIALSEHMMRHIGAQRVLLLMNKVKLFIGVDNDIRKDAITLRPIKSDGTFPESVIQYVVRTREGVLMDHAAKAEMFATDPYIRRHQVKSMLCIPLIYQNRLDALLYLENNLSSGIFTQQHLKILTRLGTQIALFLESELLKKEPPPEGGGFLSIERLTAILQERYSLTPQEAKIAVLFREGHTRNQICRMLEISATTLKKHLQKIFDKTVNLEEKYSSEGRVDKLSRLILFLFKQTGSSDEAI